MQAWTQPAEQTQMIFWFKGWHGYNPGNLQKLCWPVQGPFWPVQEPFWPVQEILQEATQQLTAA